MDLLASCWISYHHRVAKSLLHSNLHFFVVSTSSSTIQNLHLKQLLSANKKQFLTNNSKFSLHNLDFPSANLAASFLIASRNPMLSWILWLTGSKRCCSSGDNFCMSLSKFLSSSSLLSAQARISSSLSP